MTILGALSVTIVFTALLFYCYESLDSMGALGLLLQCWCLLWVNLSS
jgi:hypothetical protein